MKKKIVFLFGAIVFGFVGAVFAAANTSNTFQTFMQENMKYTGKATYTNMSTYSGSLTAAIRFDIAPGYYLKGGTTTTAQCGTSGMTGYYCPGASNITFGTSDQVKVSCGSSTYATAEVGAGAALECYSTASCAASGDTAHATSFAGRAAYDGGLSTCHATACANGYTLTDSASDIPTKITGTVKGYKAKLGGSNTTVQTYPTSGVTFSDQTTPSNSGDWFVEYTSGNGYSLWGESKCSVDTDVVSASPSVTYGGTCYCHLTGYKRLSNYTGDPTLTMTAYWVRAGVFIDRTTCDNQCALSCVDVVSGHKNTSYNASGLTADDRALTRTRIGRLAIVTGQQCRANINTITLNVNGATSGSIRSLGSSATTITSPTQTVTFTCTTDTANVALPAWTATVSAENQTNMYRAKRTFIGWSTQSDCHDSSCAVSSITCPKADTTYHAVWSNECASATQGSNVATYTYVDVKNNQCTYKHTCNTGYYNTNHNNETTSSSITCSACTSKPASNSHYTTASTTASGCSWFCNGGYYLNSGACSEAGSGYYSTNDENERHTCTSFRTYTKTSGTTSTSTDDCVCATGRYLNGTTCSKCAAGKYKNQIGNASSLCVSASDGYYVSTTGATEQTPCAIGSFSAAASGATRCTACDGGRTTSSTATHFNSNKTTACAVSCDPITNLHEWKTPSWSANEVTDLCEVDTCETCVNGTGAQNCTYHTNNNACNYSATCENGYSTSGGTNTGTTAVCSGKTCTCSPKTYTITYTAGDGGLGSNVSQTVTYQALFTTYPKETFSKEHATFYKWAYGTTSQLSANHETTYSVAKNIVLTALWNCNAGYYLDTNSDSTNYNKCVPCATGTYKESVGNEACESADDGYYVSTTAATSQTPCAIGSFSAAASGATRCEVCDPGYTTSSTGTHFNSNKTIACSATCASITNLDTWKDTGWSDTPTPNTVSNLCKVNTCLACVNGTGAQSCTYNTDNNACHYSATCKTGYSTSGGATPSGTSATCSTSNRTCTCKANANTITLNVNGATGGKIRSTGSSSTTITSSVQTVTFTCNTDTENVALPTWASGDPSTTNRTNIVKVANSKRYVFKGWAESSTATTGVYSIKCPTADKPYYAVWEEASCAPGGTGVSSTTLTNVSGNAPVCDTQCTANYSQSGGTNTTSQFQATGTAGTASYKPNCVIKTKYTITVSKNGGTGTLTVGGTTQTGTTSVAVDCYHGNTVTLPAWSNASGTANNLTKNSNVFTGWDTTSPHTCTATKTIKANWGGTCSADDVSVSTATLIRVANNSLVCGVECNDAEYSVNGGTDTTYAYEHTAWPGYGVATPTCQAKTKYTVTYSCGTGISGSVPSGGTPVYDSNFSALANISSGGCAKTGYSFTVWNDGTTNWTPGVAQKWTYTDNKTFTAVFQANQLTINLDKNGGTGTCGGATGTDQGTIYCTYDQDCIVPSWSSSCNFTNGSGSSAKVFTGWNTKADGTGTAYGPGANIKNIIASDDITLYAQWTTGSCSAGTGADSTQVSLKQVTDNAPVCNRKSIDGFYCSATQTGNAGTPSLTVTCTAAAKGYYAKAGYTSRKACVEGSYTSTTKQSSCKACDMGKYNTGTANTSCTSTCTSIDYLSTWKQPVWNTSNNTMTVGTCLVDTCTTGYSPNSTNTACTANCNAITLNANGGTAGSTTTLYKKTDATGWYKDSSCATAWNSDSVSSTTVKPSRSGWTFRGFFSADLDDVTGDSSTGTLYVDKTGATVTAGTNLTVNAAQTIYAAWAKNCSTSVSHGSCTLSVTQSSGAVDYQTSCSTGYTISGNNTATPSCAANQLTIDFGVNGGSGTCNSVSCTYDQACAAQTWNSSNCNLTKGTGTSSKVLTGWNTKADGTGTSYSFGSSIKNIIDNGSTTLYAVWGTPSCSVGNGTATIATSLSNKPTCAITCNNGYHVGDSGTTTTTTYSGNANQTSVSYTCNGNLITLSWLNGGHGDAPTTPESCTYGNGTSMPAAMTATGYTFDKWKTSGTYMTLFGAGAGNVPCTIDYLGVYSGTATITGTWTANTSTVTLKNGSTTVNTVTATYDSAMPTKTTSNANLTMPKSTNAVFIGYWDTSSSSGGNKYYTAGLTSAKTWNKEGAQTLYARFTACDCLTGAHVKNCSLNGVTDDNKCKYTYTCDDGYNVGDAAGSSGADYTATQAATASNTVPACQANRITINWTGVDENADFDGVTPTIQPTAANNWKTSSTVDYEGNIITPSKHITLGAGQSFLGWKFEH